jgi:hypothetical protein
VRIATEDKTPKATPATVSAVLNGRCHPWAPISVPTNLSQAVIVDLAIRVSA